ncbi:Glycosyltransferase family 90 protein [Madurella fahalii]|uniref:Glycosyltransferase family 90 protein n=1 Tax=Madurella fahalii TaxID=1157608 RepID=A0ABQ0FXN0_9PEZI
MSSQLTALCAVTSFLWLAYNLESHQIIEQPRISSVFILSIAAASSFAASFCAVWLPGPNGRFDDELGPLKGAGSGAGTRTNLPKKPRRFFFPTLVACIILRLELFHRVTFNLQCSKPGIEALLPLVILVYELLPGRRTRSPAIDDEELDPDDLGMTVFDILGYWFNQSKASISIGVLLLSWGTYLASSQDFRSTFFCSSHDGRRLVIFFQWAALLLDAAIAILMWRILAWARTTKIRLRTLSSILFASSVGTAFLYYSSRLIMPAIPVSHHFKGLGSLYVFDIVVDGLALSIFLVSTTLLATEGSPLSLAAIISFLSGLLLAVYQTWLAGTWQNISPAVDYFALVLICLGFVFFVYANNIRYIIFIHRAFVIFLLVILVITASIYTPIRAKLVFDNHPLAKIIYDARIGADRWLVHATVSNSLPVAVQEYRERHNGRDPPQKFDAWYKFAKDRDSVILDHFPQIEKDIFPFWGMPPSKIREDIRRAAAEPDMALLKIQNGMPQHNLPPASPYKAVMDDLVAMVKTFAENIPDMELAINLDERPRVLAPWDDVQRFITAARRKRMSKLLPRGFEASTDGMPAAKLAVLDKFLSRENFTSVGAFREMTALACPPGTKARSGTHWDIRDFCTSCAKPQSQGQYLMDWPLSQDICHQSDLLRLHSFHMTPPDLRPLQELLPVFSRAKTDSYSDILIPLKRITEAAKPSSDGFGMKWKKLFWRGTVNRFSSGHELLRGGHQERLVHIVNDAGNSDQTRLVLPTTGNKEKFAFEQVPTVDANAILDMDVGFGSYSACKAAGGSTCAAFGDEFETKPDAEPLRHQYVMAMDTDNGPPPDFLRILRSSSVPFYASIFKEWYSERLAPWLHFVPIDLRFHALHSTLAYFVGIEINKDDPRLKGRDFYMKARQEDGKWIAEQGKRWAEKAIRKADMEVYLFRLLLEWGRVINDNRDELGFVL